MPRTRLHKNKLLLLALPINTLTSALSFSSYAQEREKERGKNGKINKKALLAKLEKGEFVDGYIITSSDIIKIIKETDIKKMGAVPGFIISGIKLTGVLLET